MKTIMPLLGAHLSGAGGLHYALEKAHVLGCNTLQLFTKNNRQWRAKTLTLPEIDLFHATAKQFGIHQGHIFAHAIYLINIGSPVTQIAQKSMLALSEEIDRCFALGIPYLVLHPGAYVGSDEQSCLERIANNLNSILTESPHNVTILLETMAGQGSSVGYTFEQLASIINKLPAHTDRIGICIDTCHIFAAGYNITTAESYAHVWEQFNRIIGFKYLKLIHLNDSKAPFNSKVDRHQHIGKGMMGLEAFSLIINDPNLQNIPKILETPYKTLDELIPNLETMRSLYKSSY